MPNKLSFLLFYFLYIFAERGGGVEICFFIFQNMFIYIYILPKNEGQGLSVLKPVLKNQGDPQYNGLHLALN